MDAATATEATSHVIELMNIRDVGDQNIVRAIATEQQQAIDAASRIMRGQIVGNESEIPRSTTFPAGISDDVRYLVIVDYRNPVTGQGDRFPVEITSDVPILRDDVLAMAEQRALSGDIPDRYKGGLGDGDGIVFTGTAIISVTKR